MPGAVLPSVLGECSMQLPTNSRLHKTEVERRHRFQVACVTGDPVLKLFLTANIGIPSSKHHT